MLKDMKEGPVDLSEYPKTFCVPKCQESGTLLWGFQGGNAPLASLGSSPKAGSGALGLATMRNLPNYLTTI